MRDINILSDYIKETLCKKEKQIRKQYCYVCGLEHCEEEEYNHKPIYRKRKE